VALRLPGAFFNVDASPQTSQEGRIYPFLSLDALRRTFKDSIFHESFSDIVYSVPEHTSKTWNPNPRCRGKIYNALGYIMDQAADLMTPDTVYHLRIYMMMFFPLMIHMSKGHWSDDDLLTDCGDGAPIERYAPSLEHVFHHGLIPDVIPRIVSVSFWSDSRQRVDPIVHLLSKATPQRCQIRNLSDIIYNYACSSDEVYTFMLSIFKASMLGMYPHVEEPPSLDVSLAYYENLCMSVVPKSQFLKWMTENHQQLLLCLLKEFLVVGVRYIPGLHHELRADYHWDTFERTVKQSMHFVRQHVDLNDLMGFPGIEQRLIYYSKQNATHLYRPPKMRFPKLLLYTMQRHDDNTFTVVENSLFDRKHRLGLYDLVIRRPDDFPIDLAQYFGVRKTTIRTLNSIYEKYKQDASRVGVKNFVKEMDKYEFECVRDLMLMVDRRNNCHVYDLPVHTTVAQIRALRVMYGVPDQEPLPESAGTTYVCVECMQFKGFCASMTSSGKRNNLYACGHSKVLVDDLTGDLYCGRRSDKLDGKKRNHYSCEMNWMATDDEQESRRKKRQAKEKRKEYNNHQCSSTKLVAINLIGRLFQWYGSLYTICQECGNYMKYSPAHISAKGFYCGCCLTDDGKLLSNISCFWCHTTGSDKWSPIVVDDERKTIYLCKSCHKPWIKSSTSVLPLRTITKGLREKWKRLQTI